MPFVPRAQVSKTLAILSLMAIALAACSKGGWLDPEMNDPIDRELHLSRDDYENINNPGAINPDRPAASNAISNAPKIPDIAPILSAPRPPKIGQTQLVSITVTDDVPLKDVLLELARLADVDIEVDAGIEGGITFRAKDKPFNEVIARIADLAGLRYTIKDGVLRVERDIPYVKNYSLDFLNLVRTSESNINVATDVLAVANSAGSSGGGGGAAGGGGGGGGSGGGSSGFSTGSASTITAKAEGDFWSSLEGGVKAILKYQPQQRMSAGAGAAATAAPGAAPAAAPAAGAGGAASGGTDTLPQGTFMVVNRQAGVLSVSASERQQEMIERLINQLRISASAQVLIEAKIVEVQLNKTFQSGIDWELFQGGLKVNSKIGPSSVTPSENTVIALSKMPGDVRLDFLVNLLEQFGTTRTLSSPRLHAINNQQAVLTFAQNKTFFQVEIQQEDAQFDQTTGQQTSRPTTNITSTRQSIPLGIIMTLIPSIDLKEGTVTLNVRPTLSRQVSSVDDPGSALLNSQIKQNNSDAPQFVNSVPVVEVRELDSMLKVQSGGVMIIGGLMQQENSNTDNGLPGASGIPWVGNLFKSQTKTSTTKELVIFIRATIVNPQGNASPADKDIYENFTKDPRPLKF